jgi:tetratricopeptide (TPR) repeat protein
MNELIYDKFERYYKGLMSDAEANEFAEDLEQDQELKSQFSNYKIAILAIEQSIATDIKSKFQRLDADKSPAGRTARIIRLLTKWAAVAVVLLICVLAVSAWYEVSVLNRLVENELFFAYKVETLRTDEQQYSDLGTQLEKADYYYEQGNYDDAIALYRLIQQNQEIGNNMIVAAAEFHECMALYRSQGRHPSFDLLLDRIAEDVNHPHFKKAYTFRDQLNKKLVNLVKG